MNKTSTVYAFLKKNFSRVLVVPAILGAISLTLCLAPEASADSFTGLASGTGTTGQSPCVASPPNLIADPAFQDGCDTFQSDSEPGNWRFVFAAELYTGDIGLPCCGAEFFYSPDAGGTSAGSVDQLVDTTIGQQYLIDFMLATNDVSDGALVTVEFGTTVGLSETNGELGIPPDQYMEYSFLASATDSVTDFAVIGFGGTSTPNYEFVVTDVSVTAVENAPEPATLILLAAGLALICGGACPRRSRLRRSTML